MIQLVLKVKNIISRAQYGLYVFYLKKYLKNNLHNYWQFIKKEYNTIRITSIEYAKSFAYDTSIVFKFKGGKNET